MLRQITVAGQPLGVVALPASPGLRSVQFDFFDAVAVTESPFNGITQTQGWPGADRLTGNAELPPLTQAQLDAWVAALMSCRGMVVPFLLGDPMKRGPAGNPQGSLPKMDAVTTPTAAGATSLNTRGWKPGQFRLLLAGDLVQLGYRLHRVLSPVSSDAQGRATLSLWPSLREAPVDGAPVILSNPKGPFGDESLPACGPVGLFRRAENKNTWSADYTRLSHLSFRFMEYR